MQDKYDIIPWNLLKEEISIEDWVYFTLILSPFYIPRVTSDVHGGRQSFIAAATKYCLRVIEQHISYT